MPNAALAAGPMSEVEVAVEDALEREIVDRHQRSRARRRARGAPVRARARSASRCNAGRRDASGTGSTRSDSRAATRDSSAKRRALSGWSHPLASWYGPPSRSKSVGASTSSAGTPVGSVASSEMWPRAARASRTFPTALPAPRSRATGTPASARARRLLRSQLRRERARDVTEAAGLDPGHALRSGEQYAHVQPRSARASGKPWVMVRIDLRGRLRRTRHGLPTAMTPAARRPRRRFLRRSPSRRRS